jgi:cyclic 2,3-diphosphoglycerate synthetase
MRTLALVDGEHYPPVTRWALEIARERGHQVVAALLVGGIEKIDPRTPPDLGVALRLAHGHPAEALAAAIDELAPEAILDLSDEPILGYRERFDLVAVALVHRVPYLGADFRFDPPAQVEALAVPTLAVIGTGKRTGKTAIAGELARTADVAGHTPVVVAMGRGGPPEPQVAEAGSVDLSTLLDLAHHGRHAASDYLEDALTTGVTTIGARRAGGGLAGDTYATNVAEAARLAAARKPGVVILEGSGAAIPPVPWDAGLLVVPASAPPEYLGGYLGPYRLLRSDLVVVTMAGSPTGLENLSALLSHVRRVLGDARYLVTDFRPTPLRDVRGSRVFFATTAPADVAATQVTHLEADHGCEVVGWSARLADRAGLEEDLDAASDYDLLLTELKAAAVDVASERALRRGAEVVFVDNRPVAVEGDAEVGATLTGLIDLARERAAGRSSDPAAR